jgi:hypothetical protein
MLKGKLKMRSHVSRTFTAKIRSFTGLITTLILAGCGAVSLMQGSSYYGPIKTFDGISFGYQETPTFQDGFLLTFYNPANEDFARQSFERRAREVCAQKGAMNYRVWEDDSKTNQISPRGPFLLGTPSGYVECVFDGSSQQTARQGPAAQSSNSGVSSAQIARDVAAAVAAAAAAAQRPSSSTPPPARAPASSDQGYLQFGQCLAARKKAVPAGCQTCARTEVCNSCQEPLDLTYRSFRSGKWAPGGMATVRPGQCHAVDDWEGTVKLDIAFCKLNDGFNWETGRCRR